MWNYHYGSYCWVSQMIKTLRHLPFMQFHICVISLNTVIADYWKNICVAQLNVFELCRKAYSAQQNIYLIFAIGVFLPHQNWGLFLQEVRTFWICLTISRLRRRIATGGISIKKLYFHFCWNVSFVQGIHGTMKLNALEH